MFSSYINNIKKIIVRGWALFYIRFKHKGDVIVLTQHIGDDVYGLAFIHEFKKYRKKHLTLIGASTRKRLYEYYSEDYDELALINPKSTKWEIYQQIHTSRRTIKLARRFLIFSSFPYRWIPIAQNDGRNALTIIRDDMLQLPNTCKHISPNFSSEKITTIHCFDNLHNKIVILNPYSASMDEPDFSLFEEIAKMLIGMGFIVYTNVIGDQSEIKGTRPLRCSLYEFYAICNKVPLVVSVRSGILDLCISSKTNFMVYYFPIAWRKKCGSVNCFFNEYTLSAWGYRNVKELIYNDNLSAIQALTDYMREIKIVDNM